MELDIEARELDSQKKINRFSKHIAILFHKKVEDMMFSVEEHNIPLRENSYQFDHIYYSHDDAGAAIHTKHFSKFKQFCGQHAEFEGTLRAAFFRKLSVSDVTLLKIKVVVFTHESAKKVPIEY